jgi:hypothetical protein
MSASTRTAPHLRLVSSGPGGEERLQLGPSQRLREFAAAAAAAGLGAEEAVRLAIERALALADATAFGLDPDAARALLSRAAGSAQPVRPLPPARAAYVRGLGNGGPRQPAETAAGLVVSLPGPLLTRARDSVSEAALDPAAVPGTIAWEVAAALEGRTMGEWALRTLARRRTAA